MFDKFVLLDSKTKLPKKDEKAQLIMLVVLIILIVFNVIVFTTRSVSDKINIDTKQNQYFDKE